MQSSDVLTVSDIAARLRLSEETVRQWLREGTLRGYNFGGRAGWRVPETEFTRFLASRSARPDNS